MESWIDLKYIRILGAQLSLFKEKNGNLWNFRCPLCGDSAKDETSTRGYIYMKDGAYKFKCHNCTENHSFSYFLKLVNIELHKEHRLDVFKERNSGRKETPKRTKRTRKVRPKPKVQELPDFPKELDGFECISSLPDAHLARRYVQGRGIPESVWNRLLWADNMKLVANAVGGYEETHFEDSPRLILPFVSESGRLTHVQGRAIGEVKKKKDRYITLTIDEDSPKAYGLDKIDRNLHVNVVEGPIDSLFISNCVGMGGADIPWHVFEPGKTTFIWDNEPRSEQIIKRMKEAIALGYSVCIWGKTVRQNDINDIILSGRSVEWLDRYITSHSFSGMRAKLEMSRFSI